MKNIWLNKNSLKAFPIGSRILVIGGPDIDYHIDEHGTVVAHHEEECWVGVVLDKMKNDPGNNTIWFLPKEIIWTEN